MLASLDARARAGLDLQGPICVYALCEALGVTVRFAPIASMEGMYVRTPAPRIHLSAFRPLPRRAYTCAHELGHHVFSHGSTIDELREETKASPWEDPKEFLADTFAGFLTMPTLGLRRAFAARGWKLETAGPRQVFAVSCEFGVGYAALVTHMAYGVGMIPRGRAAGLRRATPKTIRADILGDLSPEPLVVADEHWASPTLDAEVGTQLLLPAGTRIAGSVAEHQRDLPAGRLFRAERPGIAQASVPGTLWAIFVRVSRRSYVGLARFRHLEDDPDE
jgi:hypothetical protein